MSSTIAFEKETLYSLLVTLVSFMLLIVYYIIKKPEFVLQINSQGIKTLSLRISVVYALLFSTSIGLLVLFIMTIKKYIHTKSNSLPKQSEVEIVPTIKH